MSNQIIVTIGREYGSRGHEIGAILAKKLGIKLYDKDILRHMVENKGFDKDIVENYDEKKHKYIISRTVRDYSNSIEDILAEKVFEFQRECAKSGESFVIVGRCAEYILKDYPNVVKVFINGDYEEKLKHIISEKGISPKAAEFLIKKYNRNRKAYHNYHCETKWGDSRGYDITVNSSRLGTEETADLLYNYVQTVMKNTSKN